MDGSRSNSAHHHFPLPWLFLSEIDPRNEAHRSRVAIPGLLIFHGGIERRQHDSRFQGESLFNAWLGVQLPWSIAEVFLTHLSAACLTSDLGFVQKSRIFIDAHAAKVDFTNGVWMTNWLAGCWFGERVDTIGAFIVLGVGLIATLVNDPDTTALVGLALTFTLQFMSLLQVCTISSKCVSFKPLTGRTLFVLLL